MANDKTKITKQRPWDFLGTTTPSGARDNIITELRELPDAAIRGRVIDIPVQSGPDPQPLLRHQVEAVQRVEAVTGQALTRGADAREWRAFGHGPPCHT